MSHFTVTGVMSALRLAIRCFPLGVTITLLPAFLARLPCQFTLWETGAVLLTTSVCPSRNPIECGTNAHTGWSRSTFFCWIWARFAWIGGFVPSGFVIQTNTFLMPLFAGLTTHSSLRMGPLPRQCEIGRAHV